MKKVLKTSIATGIIALCISTNSLAYFEDINNKEVYLPAINYLAEKGVISGYPDKTFKPENKVKRAEFAKMISISEKLELKKENEIAFSDINNHWATEYINLATTNELLKGYEDKTFKPQKEITYGEVATIMLRTLGVYQVANNNVNWPEDCMRFASSIGMFNGIATNDLVGTNPARRDNVALIIYNTEIIKNKMNEEKTEPSGDVEEKVEDNKSEEAIQEIDTKKVYIGTIDLITERRGEYYITVKDFEGNDTEIKLKASAEVPKIHSLIMYKLSSKGNVRLEKLLKIDDLEENFLLVEAVEEEVAKLQNIEKLLDLQEDTFEYNGKTIKMKRYDFYFADMAENDNGEYEFENVELVKKEDIKLKKEDRIIFDEENKIAFIIRGIEVDE